MRVFKSQEEEKIYFDGAADVLAALEAIMNDATLGLCRAMELVRANDRVHAMAILRSGEEARARQHRDDAESIVSQSYYDKAEVREFLDSTDQDATLALYAIPDYREVAAVIRKDDIYVLEELIYQDMTVDGDLDRNERYVRESEYKGGKYAVFREIILEAMGKLEFDER